jgi:hypothetical protein
VRRATLTAIAALVALLALPATASAITKTWEGDVDNNWGNPQNWDTISVPTDNDTAVISSNSGTNPDPVVSDAGRVADAVQLSDGQTLTVLGGTLQVDHQITAPAGTNVTVSGATGNLIFGFLPGDGLQIANSAGLTLNGGFIDGAIEATAPNTTVANNAGTSYGAASCSDTTPPDASSCIGGLFMDSNVSITQATTDVDMGGDPVSLSAANRFLNIEGFGDTYTLNGASLTDASAQTPTVFVGNDATLRKVGVAGGTVDPTVTVAGSGTVHAALGTLDITNSLTNLSGNTLSDGIYAIDSGGTLQLPTVVNDLDADLSITSSGALEDTAGNPGLENLDDILSDGNLTLRGNHAETTPPTTLSNVFGTLALNDTSTLSNGTTVETDIEIGGLFTGTGTFDGDLENNGTVAPGTSPGLLTVSGDYEQNSSGQLNIEVNGTGDGQFDVLRVDGGAPGPPPGDANLNGELALLPSAAYAASAQPGDAVSFLRYDGDRFGEFDSPATVSPPLSGGKPYTAEYDDPANRVLAVVGEGPPPPPPPPPPPGDTAAPDTQITKGPAAKTKNRQAGFDFTSTEPGSTFNCAVDGQQAFRPCTSPTAFKVARGTHTFSVQATDAAGNVDPTPATYTWKVRKKKPKK